MSSVIMHGTVKFPLFLKFISITIMRADTKVEYSNCFYNIDKLNMLMQQVSSGFMWIGEVRTVGRNCDVL